MPGIVNFRTNASGQTNFPKVWHYRPLYRSNGTLYYTYSSYDTTYVHFRSAKTSNPTYFLSGSSTKWRPKSNYTRWNYEILVNDGTYEAANGTMIYKNCSILPADLSVYYRNHNPDYNGAYGGLLTSSSVMAQIRNKSDSKALSDLASKKASMGENLLQLSQTINSFVMVIQDAIQVLRAFNGIRRGRIPNLSQLNVRSLRRLVKNGKLDKRAANYWLAYYYGWKPMIGDAEGIYELIKELAAPPALLVHGRGFAEANYQDSFQESGSSSGFSPKGKYHYQEWARSVSYTTLTGRMSNQLSRNLNRLGLVPTPSLAWELIPFSFVVDWFTPVGSILEGLSATSGLTFVDGSRTISTNRAIKCSVDPSSVLMGDPSVEIRRFGFDRSKLGSWPRPWLYDKPFYTGADRLATIAALISNLTRR